MKSKWFQTISIFLIIFLLTGIKYINTIRGENGEIKFYNLDEVEIEPTIKNKENTNVTDNNDESLIDTPLDWDVVDQHQNGVLVGAGIRTGLKLAQSFVPNLNRLTRVKIVCDYEIYSLDYLKISIRSQLDGNDLISKDIPLSDIPDQMPGDWITVDFPDISVTPNETYYIVFHQKASFDVSLRWWGKADFYTDPYKKGCAWVRDEFGWRETNAGFEYYDFSFKTYGYISITNLKEKWNFFSCPYNLTMLKKNFTIRINNNIFSWNEAVSLGKISDFVFGWNRISQSYAFENNITSGYGNWMYSYKDDCTLTLEKFSEISDDYITSIKKGWIVIGFPYFEQVDKTNILVNNISWNEAVTNNWISDYVFRWNRGTQSYGFSDVLAPGQAYWLYANQQCVLKRNI